MIGPTTTMGAVHLNVSDLERSRDWYRDAIGLEILHQEDAGLSLGAGGRELLRLYEVRGARPVPGSTGLYHFALLLPRRQDLARWLAHATEHRVPLTGMSDHFVSEALYLKDPDEHGIEIYWDRPRELWQGQVAARLTSEPLDLAGLMAELGSSAEPFRQLPEGTVMGHVHLRVAEIPGALEFYRDLLGFELMAQLPRAAFLGAGGYHHHLGVNTWGSAGGAPAPPSAAALRHATLVLADAAEREALLARLEQRGVRSENDPSGRLIRDPSGNAVVLAARAEADH